MSDLASDLRSAARDAARVEDKRDVLERALAAALAENDHMRGWALVSLAAALRDDGRFEDALRVLDHVERRSKDDALTCAVFTCAIAIHGDLGDFGTAVTLVGQQRERNYVSVEFLRAEARARYGRWESTQSESDWAALDRVRKELLAAEAVNGAAA